MSSSIFSFDDLSRAWSLPRRVTLAWLARAVAVGAVLWSCSLILEQANPAIRAWNTDAGEILFVGTSHTGAGIDSRAFGAPAGVVSYQGLDLRLAAATIGRHAREWPRLKQAFLEVDEFALLTDMTHTSRDNPLELLARLDLSLADLPPSIDRSAAWRARTLLSGQGAAALDPSVRFTTQRLLLDGRRSAREHLPLTPSAGFARARYLERIAAGQVADNITALVELTRLLTARGAEVTLISYPAHAHYRAARLAEWDRHIERAVAEVNATVGPTEYWDFRGDEAFGDTDFMNVDHLSMAGALKLSKMIAGRIPAGGFRP